MKSNIIHMHQIVKPLAALVVLNNYVTDVIAKHNIDWRPTGGSYIADYYDPHPGIHYNPKPFEDNQSPRSYMTPILSMGTSEYRRMRASMKKPTNTELTTAYGTVRDFPNEEAPERGVNDNLDTPDNLSFYVMGINDRVNEHLDHQSMNDRDFRERCDQVGGANFVLYPKTGHNVFIGEDGKKRVVARIERLRPPSHLDPAKIAATLSIPIDLAIHLADALRRIGADWKMTRQLLMGVDATGSIPIELVTGEYKGKLATGIAGTVLKNGIARSADKVAAVNRVIAIADSMDEVTVKWPRMENLDLIENHVGHDEDPYWADADLGPDQEAFIEDDLDLMGANNPFSSYKLYHGAEAISYQFCQDMKRMSDTELAALTKNLYPQGDKKYVAWRWMTADQKKHFWGCYRARKEALAAEIEADVNFRNATGYIRHNARGLAAACIYAFAAGEKFEPWGIPVLDGQQTPSKTAIKKLWAQYNEKFPKQQKAA